MHIIILSVSMQYVQVGSSKYSFPEWLVVFTKKWQCCSVLLWGYVQNVALFSNSSVPASPSTFAIRLWFFLPCFSLCFIRTNSLISSSFSCSSESSSNQSCSDTPWLIILASCRSWSLWFSLLCMCITMCNIRENIAQLLNGRFIQHT